MNLFSICCCLLLCVISFWSGVFVSADVVAKNFDCVEKQDFKK